MASGSYDSLKEAAEENIQKPSEVPRRASKARGRASQLAGMTSEGAARAP